MIAGDYSEATDSFAVGVALLVLLTGLDPVNIEDQCEENNDDTRFARIDADCQDENTCRGVL